MRIHPSYLALFGALALAGCPDDMCPPGTTRVAGVCTIVIVPSDGGDAGGDAPTVDGGGRDTGTPPGCAATGTMGGHCRMGMCNGSMCQQEYRAMGGTLFTLASGFGIDQGVGPADANGFYEVNPTPVAADDVPTPIATGGICTQRCDATVEMDPCGMCATCDQTVGTIGLIATYFLEQDPPFGDNTGWCRADCVYDPATAGATCPPATMGMMDAHTCHPGTNTCVEGCISDNECRFSFEPTREGFFVSILDRSADAATCSPTTHRCEWTHADTETVGDACENNYDCAEDVGLCLRGGTCGEYQCGTAADTTMDGLCDGGAGICLGNGGNMGTLCVDGCASTADCLPGNVCLPLEDNMGNPVTIGGHTGYCLGICDARLDDPDGTGPLTTADDAIFACRTGEQCDYPDSTADDLDPTGECREPCSVDADCTGDEGNYCEIVPGSGSPGYGFCRWLGQACDYLDLNDDCYGTQVCDLLAWPENPGLCVDRCDPAASEPCPTAGDTCVPGTGTAPRFVCRTPCTPGGPACGTGETCLGGYCEQLTTM